LCKKSGGYIIRVRVYRKEQKINFFGDSIMSAAKFFRWMASISVCALLITAGCTTGEKGAEPKAAAAEQQPIAKAETGTQGVPEKKAEVKAAEKPIEVKAAEKPAAPVPAGKQAALALKFTQGDVTTYKVITQAEDKIDWVGTPDKDFKNQRNASYIDITFDQQIESVDGQGNAVAKITIKTLKCSSVHRNEAGIDFDSAKEADVKSQPIGKLIGQSYTVKLSPAGKVLEIIDAKAIQAAVSGETSADKEAYRLVEPDLITERHTIAAMPAADKSQARIGDKWNSVKDFDFRMMGKKSYERVYTLKEIKDGQAIITMNAIPTSKSGEEESQTGFSKMFDNKESYEGETVLATAAGKVDKSFENLKTEWTAVDPESKADESKEPSALRMTSIRNFSVEKVK
jgi:hypothetical protein